MTQHTSIPVDGRDVLLRDKYREMVSDFSSQIMSILKALQREEKPDVARLAKLVRDLDSARQQLMTIEVRLSNESIEPTNKTTSHPIDFDQVRQSIGRRLDRLRSAQGPRGIPE